MTAGLTPITGGLWLQEDFLTGADIAPLEAFLAATPTIAAHEPWDFSRFAFRRLVHGGAQIVTRLEACCGNPIWSGSRPIEGALIPHELLLLVDRVDDAVREIAPNSGFTSVYADHYECGGRFVPHIDRDCYGPLVAGVSIGEGTATLRFSKHDAHIDAHLQPGSLYVFGPPLRYRPWQHEIFDVTGRRFGVTLRTGSRQ